MTFHKIISRFAIIFKKKGLFEQRIDEYREEMADEVNSLRSNAKAVGKKIKKFFQDSGELLVLNSHPIPPYISYIYMLS